MSKQNPFGTKGWLPARIGSLKGKTYIITGANSGTGFEATRILLSKGAKVVMLNRNPEKSTAAIKALQQSLGSEIDVSFIRMDLGDLSSVRKAAEQVNETVDRIDALLCNGAIAQVPKRQLTVDGFESQLGVNHYGHFLLQGLLFPLIEQSKGRIVTVGSMGYNLGIKAIKFDDMNWNHGYTGNKAYSQSKLAQIMSVYELQDRLEKAGKTAVKVYACHPGASRTSLIKTSGSLLMRVMFHLMKPLTQSAEQGAYPELMCALEPDLNPRGFYGPTGRGYWVGPVGECELKPHALDKSASKKLWEISEKATGFHWSL
jgi:NAD(P)-dependent dehydrogenase (short-subunit alcohol dehydrogenase family)